MDNNGDKTFYTATMARVYADQGRYDEAAQIYRYLLDQNPDRTDLQQALNDVLAKLPPVPERWPAVSELVAQWVGMMLHCKALHGLQRIRMPLGRSEQ